MRQAQTLAPRDRARSEHMSLEHHARIQSRPHARHADAVAVAQRLAATRLRVLREIEGDEALIFSTAHHRDTALVGVRRETACQRNQRRQRGVAAQFIDRRAAHFAIDRRGRAHRRDEDHIARLYLRVPTGIAAQQQIVEVEATHHRAPALELDVAQRPRGLDAARGVECARDRGETAHGVGPRLVGLAHHEHADRARIAHADAHLRADHLPRDPRLDVLAHGIKLFARDRDRPEFREVHTPIAVDHEPQRAVLRAEQLHRQLVARAERVVGRGRDIVQRREGARGIIEEVVTEGLEASEADPRHGQPCDLGLEEPQRRVGGEAAVRLLLAQAPQGDRLEPRQLQRCRTVELIGIAAQDGVDEGLIERVDGQGRRSGILRLGDDDLEQHRVLGLESQRLAGALERGLTGGVGGPLSRGLPNNRLPRRPCGARRRARVLGRDPQLLHECRPIGRAQGLQHLELLGAGRLG